MKKLIALILSLAMILSLAACGAKEEPAATQVAAPAATEAAPVETEAKVEYETVELQMATSYAENSDYIRFMNEAAAAVEEKTGGAVKITIFPGNQLGSTMDCVEMALNGANIMAGLGFANLSTYVKEASIPGYPYACADYDEMITLTNSEWWAGVKQQLLDQWGIVPTMYISNGYRQMVGSVPVKSAADFAPVITRIGLGTIGQSFIAATGGTPTTTSSFNDCYSAIQTGMFELCEGEMELLCTSGLYEVADYLSLTNHMMNPAMFFVTKTIWDKIAPEHQEILLAEFEAASRKNWDNAIAKSEEWVKTYEEAGVTVIRTEEIDLESMKALIPAIMELEGVDAATYDKFLEAKKG